MTAERAAYYQARRVAFVAALREHGHDAHLHPTTGLPSVWWNDRWWTVMGGSEVSPSLIAGPVAPAPETRR